MNNLHLDLDANSDEIRTISLKRNADNRIKFGHLWVFSNELQEIPKLQPGVVVKVVDSNQKSYGFGFYNPASLISVRLLKTEILPSVQLFIERIAISKALRQSLLGDIEMCRLVFGESDLLPGLIIDKYSNYFAIQILSAGMELMKSEIVQALLEIFPETKGIIEKNDTKLREIEGLPLISTVLFGEIPEKFISQEQGVQLELSLSEGQKTGYFLDQRINRKFVRTISRGLSVLDCYTNQGGFALNAGIGGAERIAAIDCSETALNAVSRNAELNGLKIETIKADVAEYLSKAVERNEKWDMIILDPPAFAKNRKSVPKAKAAYAKINRLAMKMLNPNGYLIASSCSHHVFEDVFKDAIYRESCKLGKQLKQVYRGGQSPDHPILLSLPETQYLKFFVFQVV